MIALLDTGAYQDACAANFNALPRPGTVMVSGDQAEWIKRPETVAEVFARDIVPERLAMSVTITAGELEATFEPRLAMVGSSLTHRREELLAQRNGVDGYRDRGSTFGIPLLHPWANRLDVPLGSPLLHDDGNGLADPRREPGCAPVRRAGAGRRQGRGRVLDRPRAPGAGGVPPPAPADGRGGGHGELADAPNHAARAGGRGAGVVRVPPLPLSARR